MVSKTQAPLQRFRRCSLLSPRSDRMSAHLPHLRVGTRSDFAELALHLAKSALPSCPCTLMDSESAARPQVLFHDLFCGYYSDARVLVVDSAVGQSRVLPAHGRHSPPLGIQGISSYKTESTLKTKHNQL